jgi:hypothetical protein
MRHPPERKPVGWRQLCAITRELIEAEPTIDDAEWKERIKQRLTALELTYPEDWAAINRAMDAVQRTLEKAWGPRPIPVPPQTSRRDPEWRGPLTHAESKAAYERILQGSGNSPPPSPSSNANSSNLSPVRDDGRPGLTPLGAIMSTALQSRSKPDKRPIVQAQIDAWRMAQPKQKHVLTPTGWRRVCSSAPTASENSHEPHDEPADRVVQSGGRSPAEG